MATAKVSAAAPRAFIAAGSHTITVPVTNGLARVPRPCTSITSVSWVLWNETTTAAQYWAFDGIDTISGLDSDWPYGQGVTSAQHPEPSTVQIVYSGGYATLPAAVKSICLAVAVRLYDNPRGLRSSNVTVGQYAEGEQYAGGGSDLASTELLPSELKALRRYHRRAGTVRLG
jgi:hypothetical protein